MANRRMFSKKISESKKFTRMSISARLLYYDLGMQADDEGFVEADNVMRMTGVGNEVLNELADNKYVCILDENGLCWITGWFENNKIKSDRFKESVYHDYVDVLRSQYPIEKLFDVEPTKLNVLKLGNVRMRNGSTTGSTTGSTSGYKNAEIVSNSGTKLYPDVETQDRLGQDRIDKDSIDNNIANFNDFRTTKEQIEAERKWSEEQIRKYNEALRERGEPEYNPNAANNFDDFEFGKPDF